MRRREFLGVLGNTAITFQIAARTHHERGRQGAKEALDRVKNVVREERVQRALDELVMLTNAPSIDAHADA